MTARRVLAAAALALALAGPVEGRPWAWLGVRIRDLTEQEMEELSSRHGMREGYGVRIVDVIASGPAAAAGLQGGDLVVGVDGRPVTDVRTLQRMIGASSIDAPARLTLLRADGRRDVLVRLAAMPTDAAGDRVAAEFGFVLRSSRAGDGDPGTRGGPGAPEVAAIAREGAAARAGLEAGDVLVEVGGRTVTTSDQAREALSAASIERALPLTVRRGERTLSLVLPAP